MNPVKRQIEKVACCKSLVGWEDALVEARPSSTLIERQVQVVVGMRRLKRNFGMRPHS